MMHLHCHWRIVQDNETEEVLSDREQLEMLSSKTTSKIKMPSWNTNVVHHGAAYASPYPSDLELE